jgi:bacteriorhodopsin
VVTLLVGALTQTAYKFGFLAFGMAAEWFVFYQLLMPARKYASAVGGSVSSTYLTATLLTVVVWLFYPIAWGLSEGGNILHPDSEAIFYGILDILAKPVVGLILVLGHRNTDFASLGFTAHEPGVAGEKMAAAAPVGGVGNGTGTGTA